LFFILIHISAARRCECMPWENGRSRRVLEYHTTNHWFYGPRGPHDISPVIFFFWGMS